jgi:hypothetical protein
MDQLLVQSAMTLGANVVPQLVGHPYAAGDVSVVAMILTLVAQESDRAADTLVRENAAIRAVLRLAPGELVAPSVLDDGDGESFKLTDLEATNATLKAALIPVHTWSETAVHPEARSINAAIWALLLRGAEDRALILPLM